MTDCRKNDCKHRLRLRHWHYDDGCQHEEMDGFLCMAFESEGVGIWVTGLEKCYCEMYERREDEQIY